MKKLIKTRIRNFSFRSILKYQGRFKISNGVKILIISIFLPFASAQAQVDNLVVQFQQTPLFKEANFLPGEGITRWVKVTNNSGQSQRIAIQPLNIADPNHLGDVLNLEIKEGGVARYNNTLSTFFSGGENYLSDLANGATAQYDLTVSFYSGSQNTFQGKSLGFDILIGFQGTEGGILPGAGSTSGGGSVSSGGLPPGLTIQNESTANTTEDSVIITWTTSYPATSQVIYAMGSESHILDLTDRNGSPPKYGYARTTPEYDAPANINGAISHSITISGLTAGTKYYYRTVSHGSLAISVEHNFITLTPKTLTSKETVIEKEQIGIQHEEGTGAGAGIKESAGVKENTEEMPKEMSEGMSKEMGGEDLGTQFSSIQEGAGENRMVAAIGVFFKNKDFKTILIIFLAAILVLFSVWKRRSKKGE